MRPRLPTSFSLMNRDYTVRKATPEEVDLLEDVVHGFCDFEEAEIVVFPGRNRDHLEHVYFHELAHALLQAIGQPKLASNEAIVDALGGALHQYEKTSAGRLTVRERKKNGSDITSLAQTGPGSRVRSSG